MKFKLILLTYFLTLNVFSQNQEKVEELGKVIFNQYVNKQVDSIMTNFFPSESAWSWIHTQWKVDEPDYLSSKQRISVWLSEDLVVSEEQSTPLQNIAIQSTEYIPTSTHLLKNEEKVKVEKLKIIFTDGKNEYLCLVGLFEFENRLWLYPEGGIQWEIK